MIPELKFKQEPKCPWCGIICRFDKLNGIYQCSACSYTYRNGTPVFDDPRIQEVDIKNKEHENDT